MDVARGVVIALRANLQAFGVVVAELGIVECGLHEVAERNGAFTLDTLDKSSFKLC